jgi:hypothetical protein
MKDFSAEKKDRIVKIFYPTDTAIKKQGKNCVRSFTSKIASSKEKNIYDIVDIFRDKIFTDNLLIPKNLILEYPKNRIPLNSIINLHNTDGISDRGQIKQMTEKLNSGKAIMTPEGLPNIKLVKSLDNEWVIFDGHHSMLAYMFTGKKYLDQTPHLIVLDRDNKGIKDEEIHAFFGKHASKLKGKNWRNFVINWEASEKHQLQKRRQKNLEELFHSFMKRIQR